MMENCGRIQQLRVLTAKENHDGRKVRYDLISICSAALYRCAWLCDDAKGGGGGQTRWMNSQIFSGKEQGFNKQLCLYEKLVEHPVQARSPQYDEIDFIFNVMIASIILIRFLRSNWNLAWYSSHRQLVVTQLILWPVLAFRTALHKCDVT